MSDLWTAEYSASQKAFHVDPLERTMQKNMRNAVLDKSNDYQVFFIGSAEDCTQAVERMREFKEKRQTSC